MSLSGKDQSQALLPGLRHQHSPHCNERPDGIDIGLLVIHNISLPPGEFGGGYVDQLFAGTLDCDAHPAFADLRGLRVSAHFFISRLGEVTQYLPVAARAWHAGVSAWCGRDNCNDFSIGIELEGTDTIPYTEAQYASLLQLIRRLMQLCPAITVNSIVGHADIAPGRKTDPGPAFDWSRVRAALQ